MFDWQISLLILVANTVTEIGRLIHIVPQAIELDIAPKLVQILVPPIVSLLLEKVWIHGVDRPDFAGKIRSIFIGLDKYILFDAGVIDRVVRSVSLGNACIDDRDILQIRLVDLFNELREVGPVDWVPREILVCVHVVNVTPDCVERQVVLSILIDHVSEIDGVLVAPLALVPSKGPHGSQNWRTDNFLVLFGYFNRILTENKSDVSNASGGNHC